MSGRLTVLKAHIAPIEDGYPPDPTYRKNAASG